jgi:hypothetical protein
MELLAMGVFLKASVAAQVMAFIADVQCGCLKQTSANAGITFGTSKQLSIHAMDAEAVPRQSGTPAAPHCTPGL